MARSCFTSSYVLWFALDKLMGARVSRSVEELGQDVSELGIEAYPEFVVMPDQDEVDEFARANTQEET